MGQQRVVVIRDRMVVYGGTNGVGADLSDTWALSLADNSWAPLAASGPDGSYGAAAAYVGTAKTAGHAAIVAATLWVAAKLLWRNFLSSRLGENPEGWRVSMQLLRVSPARRRQAPVWRLAAIRAARGCLWMSRQGVF